MQRETVWLVEDEQGIADTLVYMLQQEGFGVEVFERGLPVLDKARQQVPDVMILDVGLPDISGFELCRQLLALHPALPVLFLTARSEEVDRLGWKLALTTTWLNRFHLAKCAPECAPYCVG